MAEFATADEIAQGWRPLNSSQRADAEAKIAAVGIWIRDRKPDVADDDPAAKFVTVQAVRAALEAEKYAGHVSYSRTVGGETESGTFSKSSEPLYITDFHYQLLGISRITMPQWHFGD